MEDTLKAQVVQTKSTAEVTNAGDGRGTLVTAQLPKGAKLSPVPTDSALAQQVIDQIPQWIYEAGTDTARYGERHLQDWWKEMPPLASGRLAGDPMPFRMGADPYVSSMLLSFFLMVMLIAARSRYYLVSGFKEFFSARQRENLFSNYTESRLQGRTLFPVAFCVSLGVLFFAYQQQHLPEVVRVLPPYLLLGLNVVCCSLVYVLRLVLYAFVNAVFFSREQNARWAEAHGLLSVVASLLFLWLALLVVFYQLDFQFWTLLFFAFWGLLEICLIFKTHCIFSEGRWGFLHIILYLCTLEFLPILSMWKALVWGAQELIGFV
ncbi:hypothetical protein, membrane [gut metagenome]|uniref:DUF4271 domain-containing protein n=1 Tax=gut metagenome TaxID=749906 RepID=J9H079_9ZZZZ